MHMSVFCLLFLAGVTSAKESTQTKNGVTPIQKVLTLMEEMKAKGIAAKNDEETKFSAFSTWCQNTKKNKNGEIDAGNEKMEMLRAEIEKARVHISQLTDRIQ